VAQKSLHLARCQVTLAPSCICNTTEYFISSYIPHSVTRIKWPKESVLSIPDFLIHVLIIVFNRTLCFLITDTSINFFMPVLEFWLFSTVSNVAKKLKHFGTDKLLYNWAVCRTVDSWTARPHNHQLADLWWTETITQILVTCDLPESLHCMLPHMSVWRCWLHHLASQSPNLSVLPQGDHCCSLCGLCGFAALFLHVPHPLLHDQGHLIRILTTVYRKQYVIAHGKTCL